MLKEFTLRDEPPMSVIPPPPGATQNFVNPPIAAQSAYTLVAVGVAIAGALLVLRIYTKGLILRKFGWEDVAILLAFAFSTADCILILEGRKYGTGKHIWDIPINVLVPKWGKVVTAAVVMYCPALMFSKLAILICYLRISTKSMFRIAVYVAMAIVFAYNIALMLSLIFACHPIAKNWDATIMTGSCVNRPAIYLANGVLNVVTDFVILLLPVPMIRGLQMPQRQKILLAAMFSVGSLTAIVSIVRLRTLIPTLHAVDQTWAIAGPGNWIIVEINLAVACGCLPAVRPFLRHHFPSLMGDPSRGSRGEHYAKASRSDYFSRHTRQSQRAPEHSSESNSRLSHGNAYLPSWDTLGYSQEVKSTNLATEDTSASSPYSGEDLELGAVEAPGHTNDVESAAPSLKKSSGDTRHVQGVGRAHDIRVPDPAMGIMKTTDIKIRR